MTDRMKNKIVRKNLHMKLHETLGIQKELFDSLVDIFETYSNVGKVTVFGSRARGDHKDNSDVDICIFGHELAEIQSNIMNTIHGLNTSLSFDVLSYNDTLLEALRENIDKECVIIYDKNTTGQ